MSRRRRNSRTERPGPSGFLVVDKPQGLTSHDVVDAVRKMLGTRRIGHLGTLDPLATGVLPLAVRNATKLVPFLQGGAKSYAGAIRLGQETDTLDADGEIVRRHEGPLPSEEQIRQVLVSFVGDIEQIPPMYSAVKMDGVPLHRLARQGREVERSLKQVHIDRIELVKFALPKIEIEVDCSAGTYVRALAADLGVRLGCGGHLASLRRTRSGPFGDDLAIPLDGLARQAESGEIEARIIPPVNALGFPVVRLRREEEHRVRHGGEITGPDAPVPPGTRVAALGCDAQLLAVLEARPGRKLKPLRVLGS